MSTAEITVKAGGRRVPWSEAVAAVLAGEPAAYFAVEMIEVESGSGDDQGHGLEPPEASKG